MAKRKRVAILECGHEATAPLSQTTVKSPMYCNECKTTRKVVGVGYS